MHGVPRESAVSTAQLSPPWIETSQDAVTYLVDRVVVLPAVLSAQLRSGEYAGGEEDSGARVDADLQRLCARWDGPARQVQGMR